MHEYCSCFLSLFYHTRTKGHVNLTCPPHLVQILMEKKTPSIFSIELPPCPYPRKRKVIDDITDEIYDPHTHGETTLMGNR